MVAVNEKAQGGINLCIKEKITSFEIWSQTLDSTHLAMTLWWWIWWWWWWIDMTMVTMMMVIVEHELTCRRGRETVHWAPLLWLPCSEIFFRRFIDTFFLYFLVQIKHICVVMLLSITLLGGPQVPHLEEDHLHLAPDQNTDLDTCQNTHHDYDQNTDHVVLILFRILIMILIRILITILIRILIIILIKILILILIRILIIIHNTGLKIAIINTVKFLSHTE